MIARSVDEQLGGDGKMWVLEKEKDKLGRKSTGKCQFHLPIKKPVKRKESENFEFVARESRSL